MSKLHTYLNKCLTKKSEDRSSQMRIFYCSCDQMNIKLNVGLHMTIFLENDFVRHQIS
jgi:hypothetical protein